MTATYSQSWDKQDSQVPHVPSSTDGTRAQEPLGDLIRPLAASVFGENDAATISVMV